METEENSKVSTQTNNISNTSETAGEKQSPKKVKGILKHKDQQQDGPEVTWDEMNILETYHPANKDYGHMKINEPPTPYNHEYDEEMDENSGNLNADAVADKLTTMNPRKDHFSSGEDNDEEDEDKYLSEKALAKKKEFRQHRKQHYDEGLNIKRARELIAKEMAELEAEENSEMETGK